MQLTTKYKNRTLIILIEPKFKAKAGLILFL